MMQMRVNFSPELSSWILHNLDRGCAIGDLVNSMISQKFEPDVAYGLVHAFAHARSSGIDPPTDFVTLDLSQPDYRYAAPRLASGGIIHTRDRAMPVLMRMEKPVLAVLEGVLSAVECDAIIELSRSRLRPSTIVDPLSGEDKVAAHRDSEGMFFALEENPLIAAIDRRISQVMGCPMENGEGLQVLRYGTGAKSAPHFDFLVPLNQANRASIARSGQRISSLVIYLNDVPLGGETVFPEIGLSVSARKGNAVYFEYANDLGQLDHKSLHAGAAVTAGEKWVATKWMRERPFVPA